MQSSSKSKDGGHLQGQGSHTGAKVLLQALLDDNHSSAGGGSANSAGSAGKDAASGADKPAGGKSTTGKKSKWWF